MSDDPRVVAPQQEQAHAKKCLRQINTGTGSTNCQLDSGHGGYCSAHYTLEGLARHLGLGTISAQAAYDWFYKRETLLRLALTELETHKSDAATTEAAIHERIAALRAAAVDPPPDKD